MLQDDVIIINCLQAWHTPVFLAPLTPVRFDIAWFDLGKKSRAKERNELVPYDLNPILVRPQPFNFLKI
jgi:hypothetical protein